MENGIFPIRVSNILSNRNPALHGELSGTVRIRPDSRPNPRRSRIGIDRHPDRAADRHTGEPSRRILPEPATGVYGTRYGPGRRAYRIPGHRAQDRTWRFRGVNPGVEPRTLPESNPPGIEPSRLPEGSRSVPCRKPSTGVHVARCLQCDSRYQISRFRLSRYRPNNPGIGF